MDRVINEINNLSKELSQYIIDMDIKSPDNFKIINKIKYSMGIDINTMVMCLSTTNKIIKILEEYYK